MNVPRISSVEDDRGAYANVASVIEHLKPREPVYCLYSKVLTDLAKTFQRGFPGRVLYAVKANPDPRVLSCLLQAGIRDFDTASLTEVAVVKSIDDRARCHFMTPVRLLGAAGEAYSRYGVRDFVVDDQGELEKLYSEVPAGEVTVFVRLITPKREAAFYAAHSPKFGADAKRAKALLAAIAETGGEAALAVNVGSLVLDPAIYSEALELCADVLRQSGTSIRRLDVGGGFPAAYPGVSTAPFEKYFSAIAEARRRLELLDEVELLGEPGRALVADGMSVITQVILRKDNNLYLNDGIYGSLSEPTYTNGFVRYPTRVYRRNGRLSQHTRRFRLYGPTCDSGDVLPKPYELSADIDCGDWIEFGMIGAYGLAMRTHFNGFYPESMVHVAGSPPRVYPVPPSRQMQVSAGPGTR